MDTQYDTKTDKVIYQNQGLTSAGVESEGDYLRLVMALLDQADVDKVTQNRVMEALELDRCEDCGILGDTESIGAYKGVLLCRDCEADRRDAI